MTIFFGVEVNHIIMMDTRKFNRQLFDWLNYFVNIGTI
jgi:hypothetical protein